LWVGAMGGRGDAPVRLCLCLCLREGKCVGCSPVCRARVQIVWLCLLEFASLWVCWGVRVSGSPLPAMSILSVLTTPCHISHTHSLPPPSTLTLQALIAGHIDDRVPAPATSLVAGTRPENLIWTPIYDVPPLAQWSRGRVVLVGDAAHAMSSAAGQGLSMAVEDAYVLVQLLLKGGARAGGGTGSSLWLGEALRAYEARRRPRVEPMVTGGHDNDVRANTAPGYVGGLFMKYAFPVFSVFITRMLRKVYTGEP
jgi:2-polyprenyl-6-methoxyphenol hydroxylase-like FAD-dependent oxidoreductase